MTTITPRPISAALVPLAPAQPAEAPKPEAEAAPAPQLPEITLKPNWLFDQLAAENEQRYQRGLMLIEAFQEGLNKMAADLSKKTNLDRLKRLEETLSKPAKELEIISEDDASTIRKIAEEAYRAAGREGFLSNPGTVIFGFDGWQYNFYKDGRVTRKQQGVLTPDQVQSTRKEAAEARGRLLSGIYETQIEKSQKRIDELLGVLGALSEREQAFLSGFSSLTSGNISFMV